MSARTYLARDGDVGDIDFVVTLDAGLQTLLYQRVVLPVRLDDGDAHWLVDALERSEVTMMLCPTFSISILVEHTRE
jgi:hypothetical protein